MLMTSRFPTRSPLVRRPLGLPAGHGLRGSGRQLRFGSFRKNRGPKDFLVVLIRIVAYWGSFWGPPIFGNSHLLGFGTDGLGLLVVRSS